MLSTIQDELKSCPQKNTSEQQVIHILLLESNIAFVLGRVGWVAGEDSLFLPNKESKNSGQILEIDNGVLKSNS